MSYARPRAVIRMASATIALALGAGMVIAATPAPVSASDAPRFELPFPCGQVWNGATYENHGTHKNTHYPLDFNQGSGSADAGMTVVASAAGTITKAGGDTWNTVEIDHGAGWTTVYRHMSTANAFRIAIGQHVDAGAPIGQVGDTGSAGAYHLHYEQALSGQEQGVVLSGVAVSYAAAYFTYNGPAFTSHNCGTPTPTPTPSPKPTISRGTLPQDGSWGTAHWAALAAAIGYPSNLPNGSFGNPWNKTAGGTYSAAARAFQVYLNNNDGRTNETISTDGYWGPITTEKLRHVMAYRCRWTEPYKVTAVDGYDGYGGKWVFNADEAKALSTCLNDHLF